jgi:hypothetical protein
VQLKVQRALSQLAPLLGLLPVLQQLLELLVQ